jgi:hypothetical protein
MFSILLMQKYMIQINLKKIVSNHQEIYFHIILTLNFLFFSFITENMIRVQFSLNKKKSIYHIWSIYQIKNILGKVGLKDSSRDLQVNCAISLCFHLYLICV